MENAVASRSRVVASLFSEACLLLACTRRPRECTQEMTYALRFLNPIRHSLSSIPSTCRYSPFFHSSRFVIGAVNGKIEPIRRWVKELDHSSYNKHSKLQYKLHINARHVARHFSGGKTLRIRSLLGMSCIIGCMSFSPNVAHAINGDDFLVDYRDYSSASDGLPGSQALWMFIRKFWLPILCFLTVWLNWDHPIILTIKVVLLLFSTKPSPLSVYVFVEQVRSHFHILLLLRNMEF
uniref:Uncharacterized protein MANES_17G115000 n=1 Tax=Rhizophora mucronata TaxID=61149 RepID=A0A2P2LJR1_RHIMU